MGGSVLFTSSATFSPSVYGLATGKFINYIIIGGGGAGGSVGTYSYDGYNTLVLNTGGSNGGTSSIGSYVSANGGKTYTKTGTSWAEHVMTQLDSGSGSAVRGKCMGGNGASGWVPGKIFHGYQKGDLPYFTDTAKSSMPSHFKQYYDGG
jgi:hypothetical protein